MNEYKSDQQPLSASASDSPTQWVARWKNGDQQAAQMLFDRYAEQLARLAGSHLENKLKRRISGDDIVQSVFHSFFQRTSNDQLKVENARDLWNLLVTMTLAKTRSAGRHHRALKRTVAAEIAAPQSDWLPLELAQGPSPSEVAIFVEQVEQITEDLSPRHQEIMALRMAGNTRTEIAEITGLSRQTIYRVMQLIESRISESNEK